MLNFAVVLLGVAVLVMLYRRDRRLLKAHRAKFFDLCLDLFQAYRVTQEGPGYPLLSGRYRDHEVRLGPLIDDMAWRKVPVLWLKVTVLADCTHDSPSTTRFQPCRRDTSQRPEASSTPTTVLRSISSP